MSPFAIRVWQHNNTWDVSRGSIPHCPLPFLFLGAGKRGGIISQPACFHGNKLLHVAMSFPQRKHHLFLLLQHFTQSMGPCAYYFAKREKQCKLSRHLASLALLACMLASHKARYHRPRRNKAVSKRHSGPSYARLVLSQA
jgi:hypothetical protein